MSRIRNWLSGVKDPFSGLSHALGALLSVAGLVALEVSAAGRPWLSLAFAIYGATLVLLFTASACTHSLHCSPEVEWRLDQFDYAAIFLLIAGTYTPLCLGPLRGPWGRAFLVAEWSMAAVGVASVLWMKKRAGVLRVGLYVAMGWLAAVAPGPVLRALPPTALAWLLAGGLLYSLGAVVFTTNRPRLWPGRFSAHDLWHVMVLAGAACHFVVVARFIAPPQGSMSL